MNSPLNSTPTMVNSNSLNARDEKGINAGAYNNKECRGNEVQPNSIKEGSHEDQAIILISDSDTESREATETPMQVVPAEGIAKPIVTKSNANKEHLIDESEFELLFLDLGSQKGDQPFGHVNNGNTKPQADEKDLILQRKNFPQNINCPKKKRGRPKKDSVRPKKDSFAHGKQDLLPDRLKKKVRVESESIIDLTRREIKPILEKTFSSSDTIKSETFAKLKKEASVCTLCSKPGNFASMDALFGPYRLRIDKDSNLASPDNSKVKETQCLYVWLHRDCAIWTPSICLFGCNLIGLGSALNDAATTVSNR